MDRVISPRPARATFFRQARLWLPFALALLAVVVHATAVLGAPGDGKKGKAGQASGKKRVVIMPFEGPKAKQAQGWVTDEIKQGADVEVVSAKETSKLGKPKDDAAYLEAARKADAAAFVTGKVVMKKKGWVLEVSVRNGADGAVMESFELKSAQPNGLKNEISTTLLMRLADPFATAQTPEPAPVEKPAEKPAQKPEPEKAAPVVPAAEEPEEPEEEPEPPPNDGAGLPSPLEIGIGVRGYSRHLDYNEDLFERERTYQLGIAPSAFIYARWYPVAHFQDGVLAHLGLAASYELGFVTTTTDVDGRELKTALSGFAIGLRGRLPLGRHELGLELGYVRSAFNVTGDTNRPIPDVDYQMLRVGIDGRFRVSTISFGFFVGHGELLSAGDLESDEWFPHLTGRRFDAGVFVGQALSKRFDLVLGGDIRRYYLDMNTVRGDPHIVGGGVDQSFAGWGGLSWRWPGQPE